MTGTCRVVVGIGVVTAVVLGRPAPSPAAELQERTVVAFDRYVTATEARITAEVEGPDGFIRLDQLAPRDRASALGELQRDGVHIERLTTREGGRPIEAPGGLLHHWVGLVFVPGSTVDEALTLLQDYDRSADIFAPSIARSRLRAQDGDRYQVYLRFFLKKVISVVLDTEHDARFFRSSPDRAHSRIVSTRIAEVEDADTPRERQKPVGQDGGYLWRMNTYWRFLERDGGVYVQCESISLSRSIPTGFGWLIGPFVTSIPRESLSFTMETTRRALASSRR